MPTFVFCLEILAALAVLSGFCHAWRRDWLEDHGTPKGKLYAGLIRWSVVGTRFVLGAILFLVGWWLGGNVLSWPFSSSILYVLGFCLEGQGAYFVLFSGFSRVWRKDELEDQGTAEDKRYAAMLRWFSPADRILLGIILFSVGFWLIGQSPAVAINPAAEAVKRGATALNRGDWDSAVAGYTKAIALDPRLAKAYSGRGFANMGKGELSRAIADWSEAIRLDPACADAHHGRGLAYQQRDDFEMAVADLTEAIRLNPNDAQAYCSRGITYVLKREFDNAIADNTEAIRLNPQYVRAYCSRGTAYGLKGDFSSAVADCTEAIRLDPQCAEAYYCRGVAYDKKGEKSKAEADFAEAKRLGYKP